MIRRIIEVFMVRFSFPFFLEKGGLLIRVYSVLVSCNIWSLRTSMFIYSKTLEIQPLPDQGKFPDFQTAWILDVHCMLINFYVFKYYSIILVFNSLNLITSRCTLLFLSRNVIFIQCEAGYLSFVWCKKYNG